MLVILWEHDNHAPLTCSPGMYSYISVFYMYIFLQILWNKLLSICLLSIVGGVHIPHAVCVRHLRYVNTHPRFLRCLYTYGRSLTGTDDWGRSDAMLHDAMARDGVCTQKCDNPRTCTCLCYIIKAARPWFLPLGLYMLVRALVRMFHTGLPNIPFQFKFIYLRSIYFIATLFLVVKQMYIVE